MPKKNSKDHILDAAEAVVVELGAGHMSIDLVARKAGVSKGGLMYHFPTKESLLIAMISRLVTVFHHNKAEKMTLLKDTPARALKAAILACMESDEKRDRMARSILAASAHNPELLGPFKEAQREHIRELTASGLDFERAAIVSLASDGLMLLELLQTAPYTKTQKKKIIQTMILMLEELESGKDRNDQ